MFLPATPEESANLGWDHLDVILITGDAYIDSPYAGAAVIGKVLVAAGFRVGVIAQPPLDDAGAFRRLGEPRLFWGVTGGCVDSMVANYTATGKRRNRDDFTPGGVNDRRPDRAVIAYSNAIRRYFKQTVPIVLGGIEASLRRVAHYDAWSGKIRRSVLPDAKADYLVYGMGEQAVLQLAARLRDHESPADIRGLSYLAKEPHAGYVELPSYEECAPGDEAGKAAFTQMYHLFYQNNDPLTARGLYQKTGDRYVIQNPPQPLPTTAELDSWYRPPDEFAYERDLHPADAAGGEVRALETIRFSLTTHRGCYGECNFCAIAVHQGRTVVSRSEDSIVAEAKSFTKDPHFKGNILDVGGPTANMYGYECDKKLKSGPCDDKRCIFPRTCKTLRPDHGPQVRLLNRLRKLQGVKRVFIASGLRYDLVDADQKNGDEYMKILAAHHTSGQLKIAPEHTDSRVLSLMGKPALESLESFRKKFFDYSERAGKKQFLTYYFIAAHPGCSSKEMIRLKEYASSRLALNPEQVQVFMPAPSTWSTLMYYTGRDPFGHEKIFVERENHARARQKDILTAKKHFGRPGPDVPTGSKSKNMKKGRFGKSGEQAPSKNPAQHGKDRRKGRSHHQGSKHSGAHSARGS